jgi:hypothetical protein
VETSPAAAVPTNHGIGRLSPTRLFKKIAEAAHRPKAEVVQALSPADESGNQ